MHVFLVVNQSDKGLKNSLALTQIYLEVLSQNNLDKMQITKLIHINKTHLKFL